MKIHQNWLVWRILLVKKKGRHFTTYFSKGNFRRKKNVRFLLRSLWPNGPFFLLDRFRSYLWGGRVNICYFLDFEKFFQKKGKKGLYAYFGTLADFASLDTKKPRYQNMNITPFYTFFGKIFRNLKSNMYLLCPS